MLANTVVALLSLAAGITALPSSTTKRQTTDNEIKLYAYGTGISGMEIYGGPDGLAYISTAPTNENLTELIWPVPTVDSTWNATATHNATTGTASTTSQWASFYIMGNSSAFAPAGFNRANESAPAGASLTGFTKFGSQIMWTKDNVLLSQFWASNTTVEGTYLLNWNGDGADRADSVPVTIKTTAPTTI